ncbi:MAG: hypothetical protein M3R12_11645 [Actinomycetota bacterium]|nr:hypothetical protein [Actinomycetota bacterium]
MKRLLIALVAACGLVLATAPGALAWKPYMHIETSDRAWEDVIDDGHVTLNGREYDVPQAVEDALRNQKPYFNAGVVGPDGFPDLVFGQSIIHSEGTGKWVQHILQRAWQAQSDAGYSAAQKEQILAFAFGYATHAAGDMWAHTFINDYALGVFPGVGEILSDVDDAEIALRHLIAEGYVGDATPGYDGNPDRTQVPFEVNEDGDPEYSDSSSKRIPYAVPNKFVYDTLVNPMTVLPVGVCGDDVDDDGDGVPDDGCPGDNYTVGDPEPRRGKLIDFFLDLKASLQLQEARSAWDSEKTDCAIIDEDCYSRTITLTVNTVRGITTTTVDYQNCEGALTGLCLISPVDLADDIINNIVETYVEHWIEDIDDGLQQWPQLGLASTKALFDPGTHRDAANWICRNKTAETTQQRADCEDAVGVVDVLLYSSEDYIEDHLLSMAGAPDAVGDLLDAIGDLSDLFSDVLGPLNPITAPLADIKEYVTEFLKDEIGKAFGIDIDHIKSFLTSPTHWMNVQSVSLNLPILGPQTIDLFQPDTHERLDDVMRLPSGHHPVQQVKLPGVGWVTSTGLADDTVWSATEFEPYLNTVTQARLLLLDAAGLNNVIKGELVAANVINTGAAVATYTDGSISANVMVDGLGGSTWLRSIDSDHSWRADGRPRFCTTGSPDCPVAGTNMAPRAEKLNGGNGNYPLWESCLARPAFVTLFRDWENGTQQWPAHFDDPSAQPGEAEPVPAIALSGNTVDVGGTTYVGASHAFTLTATDATFAPGGLKLAYRITKSGGSPGAWTPVAMGGQVTIPTGGGDGLYTLELRAEDPCHTFAADTLPDGGVVPREVFLDTTPPAITITSPAPEGVIFDTDDLSAIQWTATDGGSGVDTESVTFDGAASTQGAVLDMFLLDPGTHSIVVRAADKLGNAASLTRTFKVQATSASLVSNVARACAEGLIEGAGMCNSLSGKVEHAAREHAQGDHRVEQNVLGAWVNQLEAQRGKKVDTATANRFIAFANDLIARGA